MKTILLISQYFPPDITAAAFRASETASILREDGFSVKIITALPHRARASGGKGVDENDVLRVPISKLAGNKARDYIWHYMSFMINSFFRGIFSIRDKIDYVIVTSPPLTLGFTGWALARVKKAEFILDVRDIWPDSAVGTGHLKRNSPPYRIAKAAEGFIYNKADMITCVSDDMKKYLNNRLKKETPVLVLYNGLSQRFAGSMEGRGGHAARSGQDGFIISYIGNMGYAQNLSVVIDSAKKLEAEDARFVLIGDGSEKERLRKMASSAALKNIVFEEVCGKEEAFGKMSSSDALIIILNTTYEAFNMTIPSKVFDYMWANKPILYGIEGEGRRILEGMPGNLYFDARDPDSLARAAAEVKANYVKYKKAAEGNRDFVLKNFSRENTVKTLESHLK